jgi:hypothetical protein
MALKNIMNLGKAIGVARNPTPLGVVDLGLQVTTGKGLAGHGMDILRHEMGRDKDTPPEVTITPTVRAMNEMEQAMAKQEMKQRKTVAKGGRVSYKSVFDMER